jgi:RimJ/RimL family protein N-acetyltransferase
LEIRPIELLGQRVKIVPMETKHTEELFAAGGSLDIWTYMPMVVQTFGDMERLVNDALKEREQGTQFPFVIFDKDASKLVGSTRFLDISATNRSLEIGWTWLSPSVWRTKVNTECKYLLFKHCFETLGTIRVQLKTDSRNLRSQKAIERIGGVKEGVIRNHRILSDGYRRHSVYYSVIDEEWLGVKEKLEGFLDE